MEKWLVENIFWVGLGMGIALLVLKYAIVHVYRKLVALDEKASQND